MQDKQKRIKKLISIIIAVVILASCIITTSTIIINRGLKQIAESPIIEYEIKSKKDENTYIILVKINGVEGIETVRYVDKVDGKEKILYCNNKKTVGIDYYAQDRQDYTFKIKLKDKQEQTEIIHFEIPRIQGKYTLSNGIYVNEPDLTGYNENYTRYLNINSTDNLEIGNWINGEKPANWFNYKESKWANIYVENEGKEIYYVWIPRYCFALDESAGLENARSIVKFINVYNEYIEVQEDGSTKTYTLEELSERDGVKYQVPEAFEYSNTQIPGYWMMKYTASEKNEYSLDFSAVASKTKIKIEGIQLNFEEKVEKYIYAIDGEYIPLLENTTGNSVTYSINEEREYLVNVTAIGENGKILGSMTKTVVPAKVNEPDLTGFNKETTYYVTYDDNGIETSTTLISEKAPNNWYDYADSKWANIVTRNNDEEIYYVWIPRYEFKLAQTSQRSYINFIEGTSTQTTAGYQIPEAFTYNGEEIPGYWMMKYTAAGESELKFDTEVVATNNSISTKGIITASDIDTTDLTYHYYISGKIEEIGTTSNASTPFKYNNLEANKNYTILVDIRNSNNEHIATISKQVTTRNENAPELIGFNTTETDSNGNSLPVAYYVLYDNSGTTATIGNKIKNDGSNMPSNWYNYSESKWANIVITDGEIVNGQIQNATKTTYYTWIPRYEYKITSSQQEQAVRARTDIRFIQGVSNNVDNGYAIPEAFTFNGEQIPGYWIMKYTAGQ